MFYKTITHLQARSQKMSFYHLFSSLKLIKKIGIIKIKKNNQMLNRFKNLDESVTFRPLWLTVFMSSFAEVL